jgi:hypothetical protein
MRISYIKHILIFKYLNYFYEYKIQEIIYDQYKNMIMTSTRLKNIEWGHFAKEFQLSWHIVWSQKKKKKKLLLHYSYELQVHVEWAKEETIIPIVIHKHM